MWPAYREAIERVATILPQPGRAVWLELDLDGRRIVR
jgi:hypothetical protein